MYQRYGFFMRRRALLITRDVALADDVVQETLLKLLRKGAAYRAAEHPLRWLHQVVDRSALDQLRRGRRLRQADDVDDAASDLAAPPGVDLEARNAVCRALGDLPKEDQELAICTLIDGMSQAQAAEALGVSRVTVNKRLQRIRDHARRLLDSNPEASTHG